jgi:hypothetical protein
MECAVDLGHGIACKNHQEEVEMLNTIQAYSKRAVQNTGGVYKQLSLVFLFIGIVMILGGFFMGTYGTLLVFLGIGTCVISVIYSVFGNRMRKTQNK